jgi:hypothetical protein
MADWTEQKKFYYESIRAIIFGASAALVAHLVLKPHEQTIVHKYDVERARLELRKNVIDDYLTTTSNYLSVPYSSCVDKLRTEPYGASTYDQYVAARYKMDAYFSPKLDELLKKSNSIDQELRACDDSDDGRTKFDELRNRIRDSNRNIAKNALASLNLRE